MAVSDYVGSGQRALIKRGRRSQRAAPFEKRAYSTNHYYIVVYGSMQIVFSARQVEPTDMRRGTETQIQLIVTTLQV